MDVVDGLLGEMILRLKNRLQEIYIVNVFIVRNLNEVLPIFFKF